MTTYDTLYIGGEWLKPSSSALIVPTNPTTEASLGSVPEARPAEIDKAVAAAHAALDDATGWSTWDPQSRARTMERFADELQRRSAAVAAAVSSQNGMPIAISSQLETAFPVAVLRYYASLARNAIPQEDRQGLLGGTVTVRHTPVGVVAAIVPWNFPQALTMLKLAPAMASGCTVVLKPAPETVFDSFLLAEAAAAAGVPAGVLNVVPAGRKVGAYLVSHPGVDKVAFTGSTAAGRTIAEVCGRLLRPVTLELGGKSAAIILDDANLNLAAMAEKLFGAVLLNNGQTCFIGTRILAPRSRLREVEDMLAALVDSLVVGNPLDTATQIGPLVSSRQRERVEDYIDKGRAEGGTVVAGGARPAGLDSGWFVQPTVFTGLDNNATIAREEIFGPVLTIIPHDGDEDAVRIANDSDYGLGGSVWTEDPDRGFGVARRVRTGTIGINGYLPDPAAPFGGMRASGLGRELGPEGLTSYQQTQSIYRG